MEGSRNLAFLIIFVAFVGCTPSSENGVRKARVAQPEELTIGRLSDLNPEASINQVALDPATRTIIRSYGATIRRYSDIYGFDWRLVVAIMKAESGFSIDAESERGASGLMQIMPATSQEVGQKLEIEDMSHPMNNIHGGIYYLGRLYRLFEGTNQDDRVRLTLAAYNAGAGRIYDAQEVAAYFQENPTKWQAVRDALPLLSKRYYTLHRNIWPQEKPRSGWFGSSRETVAYVEKIMKYYDEYRQTLN